MRIAHVISTPGGIGGAEQVVAELVHEGARRGCVQLVLNPFARDPHDPEILEHYEPAYYRGKTGARLPDVGPTALWLGRWLSEFRPDVVHAHLFHAGVVTALVRRGKAAHVYTHHHGDTLQAEGRTSDLALDRWAVKRFDKVIAVSRAVEAFLSAEYKISPPRLTLIRNGWSGTPATHTGGGERPTLVCVARFRPQKAHVDLLEACAILRNRFPHLRVLLVGDGDLAPHLRQRVEGLQLHDTVEFAGAVTDVWPFLAQADAFVLASRYEPLGIAILEAMAAGLPVVATAVGGIPELIEDRETGILVRPGQPGELARALEEILQSPELRERMANQGRARAEFLKLDETLARYFDTYQGLREEGHDG